MKKKRPSWWTTFVVSGILSLLAGGVGWSISRALGAPGYFGGAIGFVIAGMGGLFALAARIASDSAKNHAATSKR